jgi:hypothetical protein
MATVMTMDWAGVTRDQYEAVREAVRWDADTPDGAKLHVVGFGDDGMHVTDVWESQEQFDRFMQERLGPAIQQVGLEGEPEVRFLTFGGVFAPALGHSEQSQTI